MKYLYLHRLLWAILVVAYTLLEGSFYLVIYVLYLLWNFKLPKKLWRRSHTVGRFHSHWDGTPYSDKNVWESIKRRYNMI